MLEHAVNLPSYSCSVISIKYAFHMQAGLQQRAVLILQAFEGKNNTAFRACSTWIREVSSTLPLTITLDEGIE